MEFRQLPPAEYPRLYPLWQEAFGDSPRVIAAVLTAISPAKCFVLEDGGSIVSMLFSVPQSVGARPVAYLYAVATAKAHRRQGLAAKLLSHAEAEAKKEGFHALLLCPATEALADYYANLGYKRWSEKTAPPHESAGGETISPDDYLSLRETALENVPHNTPKSAVLGLYTVTDHGVWDENRQIDCLSAPSSALALYKPFVPEFPPSGIFSFPLD